MIEYNFNKLKILKFPLGPLAVNSYLLIFPSKKSVIIDPGAEGIVIVDYVRSKKLNPIYLLNTHGHPDHTGNNWIIKEAFPEIKIGMHKEDLPFLEIEKIDIFNLRPLLNIRYIPKLDFFLEEKNPLKIDGYKIEIIHTPGHTPGSVSFLVNNKVLFSGDTIFCEGIGRTDLPGGNYEEIINSIKNKILTLPDDIHIFPGHGEDTTVFYEKNNNPFLRLK